VFFNNFLKSHSFSVRVATSVILVAFAVNAFAEESSDFLFHDAHFHLTNYIQEGADIKEFLEIMGDKVGRVEVAQT